MKDSRRIFIPILAIVLSTVAFTLVAILAWPNITNQNKSNQSENSNSTLSGCGGYYIWNKVPNESQGNILSQRYNLVEVEQTAQSLGYVTSWPTENEWITLRKKTGQDTYNISIQKVSRTDDRQRITTILTTKCNKSDSQVKSAITAVLSELKLETGWIANASVEIDNTLHLDQ